MKIKKIKPLFTAIVTTANKYEEFTTQSGIIVASKKKGDLKPYQTVIAVGDSVRNIKPGDVVSINFTRYARPVQVPDANSIKNNIQGYHAELEYHFNILDIDGKECLFLQNNDIDFVIEEFEE